LLSKRSKSDNKNKKSFVSKQFARYSLKSLIDLF
jgi:hypothetical protein